MSEQALVREADDHLCGDQCNDDVLQAVRAAVLQHLQVEVQLLADQIQLEVQVLKAVVKFEI